MNNLESILSFRLTFRLAVCVSLTVCVSLMFLPASDLVAENPLRFGALAPMETTTENARAETSSRNQMPAEVERAIYQTNQSQTGQNQARIHYDRSVQPASHVASFQVRQIPSQGSPVIEPVTRPASKYAPIATATTASASTPAVEADQFEERKDLALLGTALNSLQQQPPAHQPVQQVVPASHEVLQPAFEQQAVSQVVEVAQYARQHEGVANALVREPLQANPAAVADSDSQVSSGSSLMSNPKSPQFRKIIEQIAMSTCLVLCGGVGFILVAKQFFKMKQKPLGRTSETNSIEIKSKLALSPKSNLFLVETGKHRMVVASDQTGIRSVVPLTDSFAEAFGSLEDEAAVAAELSAAPSMAATNVPEPRATNSNSSEVSPGKLPPEMYSLATVGQRAAGGQGLRSAKAESKPTPRMERNAKTANDSKLESEAKIRRKMEDALRDGGLKDLLLQSLQAKAA